MKKLIFIVFLFTGLFATAQDGNYDEFLARQFLQNGEFAKAAEYYEGLFKQNPAEYYDDYLDILVQLKDFEKAEKVNQQYCYRKRVSIHQVLLQRIIKITKIKKINRIITNRIDRKLNCTLADQTTHFARMWSQHARRRQQSPPLFRSNHQ